jgi:hypothetical protein
VVLLLAAVVVVVVSPIPADVCACSDLVLLTRRAGTADQSGWSAGRPALE